jgi:CheY-like chemotaxis protein
MYLRMALTVDSSDAKPVVMVVEPEVLVRMTIAEVLRNCGYKVIEGIVAEDVWTVLAAGADLDIIFSEVQLAGGADGFALARRVRQMNPGSQLAPHPRLPDDFYGHRWDFTETIADVEPESWGGTSVKL